MHRCSMDLLGRGELPEPLVRFHGDWTGDFNGCFTALRVFVDILQMEEAKR